jgi:Dimethlysulfonioproprionate lyase
LRGFREFNQLRRHRVRRWLEVGAMPDWDAIVQCARAILASSSAPEVPGFLAQWPAPRPSRAALPATLPVLRWLPEAADAAPAGPLAALAQRLRAAAAALEWRQSYRPGEVAAPFLERYGWCELFGFRGPTPSVTLAGGFLLLGPDTLYPSHSHPAEELYLPLAGVAEWQVGDASFVPRPPGDIVVHAARVAHAMRTGAAPLLAFYLWRGDGLEESARLETPASPSVAVLPAFDGA